MKENFPRLEYSSQNKEQDCPIGQLILCMF
jgi:hypothetical protein